MIPVMLSVPNPSLAARFDGQILSIIWARTPHSPPIIMEEFFVGDFVGELPLSGFLAATKLFLPEELELAAVEVLLCFRVGDPPEFFSTMDCRFCNDYLLYAS